MPDAVAPAWSDLHDLALVYLALLYSPSASPAVERAPQRAEDARSRLAGLYPGISEARLHRAFHEALLMYVSVAGAPMLDVAVASLRRTLPRPRRLAVLDDLASLAADGSGDRQSAGASFLQYLAVRWDLEARRERSE